MSDDFIAWLYCLVQYQIICKHFEDCNECPFLNPKKDSRACIGLTADQKREILLKIYESEVNTDASNN